ncbi:unnamed protein product [Linum trigynum]|uniref:Uncharacterized protein n=1 Tax=Linum trigynum TaxID=586398 RepID=A0AAV2E8Z4_9ROSI
MAVTVRKAMAATGRTAVDTRRGKEKDVNGDAGKGKHGDGGKGKQEKRNCRRCIFPKGAEATRTTHCSLEVRRSRHRHFSLRLRKKKNRFPERSLTRTAGCSSCPFFS